MAFKRAMWKSGLTYQQTCRACGTTIQYMDDKLDFRPWYADGFVYCPVCRTPLRHSEQYAINSTPVQATPNYPKAPYAPQPSVIQTVATQPQQEETKQQIVQPDVTIPVDTQKQEVVSDNTAAVETQQEPTQTVVTDGAPAFCPKCGRAYREGDNFCAGCGNKR